MSFVIEIDTPPPFKDSHGDHGYYVFSRPPRPSTRPPAASIDDPKVARFDTREEAAGGVEWLTACGLTCRVIEIPPPT